MIQLRTLVLIIVGAVALTIGVWFGIKSSNEPPPTFEINGILLPQPRTVDAFSLTDSEEQPFNLDSLKGRWSFIYFGFTFCPDICPTTLSDLNTMDSIIADSGAKTAYWLVSVDPERDTPARLGEYVKYFNPKFQAATGNHDKIQVLARQFSVIYAKVENEESPENYAVDHSSSIVLIGPEGNLHAMLTPPHKARKMAEDFLAIRERYEDSL